LNGMEKTGNNYCLLCGGSPDVVGVFVPDDPRAYGAPAGKRRIVRYYLCQRCSADPRTPENIEKAIKATLLEGGAS
jgi:hypothetical protein